MSPHRYKQVAAIVAGQIAGGVLPPGARAPSGAALSRMTGYSVPTCRRALRILIADGVLVPGAGGTARPRVPGLSNQTLADAGRALSAALAQHRHAAGLTQLQLAQLISVPVTNVGHAETGRTWQSRPFWELADKVLNADGELLRLHDAYRAAEVPPQKPIEAKGTLARTEPIIELPATVTAAVGASSRVKCITITWIDGAVTTVYPPAIVGNDGKQPAGATSS
jgi:DNA-binding transcriptional regulator YhcF (GntR family)